MWISTTVSKLVEHSAIDVRMIDLISRSQDLSNALWLFAGALCDIQISVGLTLILYKKIGGFNKTTDNVLRQLIRVSLGNASYTSLSALSVSGIIMHWPEISASLRVY